MALDTVERYRLGEGLIQTLPTLIQPRSEGHCSEHRIEFRLFSHVFIPCRHFYHFRKRIVSFSQTQHLLFNQDDCDLATHKSVTRLLKENTIFRFLLSIPGLYKIRLLTLGDTQVFVRSSKRQIQHESILCARKVYRDEGLLDYFYLLSFNLQ